MADKSVYVLGPDLAARGLDGKAVEGITVVDYAGFVDLTVNHDRTQSWL
jgi:tRNA 2-thiouridine synthesizing protein B